MGYRPARRGTQTRGKNGAALTTGAIATLRHRASVPAELIYDRTIHFGRLFNVTLPLDQAVEGGHL